MVPSARTAGGAVFLARRTAASASVIFTDSEFSRSEIASRLRVEDARLQVIRLA